jgi:CspA family cold shock protein
MASGLSLDNLAFQTKTGGNMLKGTVKWFNDQKGFGLIQQENGPDVFVDFSGINKRRSKSLKEGEPVIFDIEENPKGFSAVNVTVI